MISAVLDNATLAAMELNPHVTGALLSALLVVRWGGDEFVFVMPGAGKAAALEVVERVLARIRQESAAAGLPVTLSAGLLTGPPTLLEARELQKRADALMYEAKRAGKSRVISEEIT